MVHGRSVTMRDVADHAGVSPATVSRALSGNRAMSPEIRDRVLASAAELGYQVNLLGRALRTRRLNAIGLVLPDLSNPFFAALAERLGSALREEGFELLISSAEDRIDVERRAIESFLGQQIHALVVIPCDERESGDALSAAAVRVPTVQFDRRVQGLDVPYVGCDNLRGIEMIADHVRAVTDEDRPVVFIGAEVTSSSARERREAFEALMPDARFMDGTFGVDWGVSAARSLLGDGLRRGTIVAAADVIAIGVQGELQTNGLRIPHDFRVIGFDGIGAAGFAVPSLTTVRQPLEEMSRAILALIADAGAGGARSALIPPEFVPGESSPSAAESRGEPGPAGTVGYSGV